MTFVLRCLVLISAVVLSAATGHGATSVTTLSVTFSESAPKDSFTIANDGGCTTNNLTLRIDLASSQGRLIFDPTGGGPGVEVFQPLEITAGGSFIRTVSKVRDGSQDVELNLISLAPGARVTFTIDVDDTLPRSRSKLGQTRVADTEIDGAKVYGKAATGRAVSSVFGADATAQLANVPCA